MLYGKYLAMNLRGVLEYRASTWLLVVAQFLTAFFWFISLWLLFERFGSIAGWSFTEVALCFAVTNIAFAIAECFARGFDRFSAMIVHGDFDRILLRPRSTAVQVIGSAFEISRLGRVLQGLIVLFIVLPQMDMIRTAPKVLTLIFMILGGAAVFTGLFVLGAVVCFFTVEGLEFINIFTDGGRELASYPLPVYGKWIQRFFTFIIPFGCVNYLPLMYLTDRTTGTANAALSMFLPLAGFVFFACTLLVWSAGVRRYCSTGS
jgi:ABC-2 type transport system permease protein